MSWESCDGANAAAIIIVKAIYFIEVIKIKTLDLVNKVIHI